MKEETFHQQIASSLERLETLWQRAENLPRPPKNKGREIDILPSLEEMLLRESLEELSNSLEELQVSSEELRQQNEELAASRELVESARQRYQELFDFAPDAYIVTTPSGNIQDANLAAEKLLNVRCDRLIGKPLIVYIPSQMRRDFCTRLDILRKGDEIRGWELTIQARQGTENLRVQTLCSAVPILTEQKQVVGLRWLLRDISERQQAQKLREKLSLLDQILCASDAIILLCDRKGKFLYASPNASRSLARSTTDLLEKTWSDLGVSCQSLETLEAQQQEVLLTNIPITAELSLPTPEGEGMKHFEYTISPMDGTNSINAVAIAFKDISKQKQEQSAINKALENQTEINRLKTRFITIIAHEFRNNLHKIFLSTDLLKTYINHNKGTEKQKEQQLDYILAAAKQTERSLHDMLLVSQAETGKLKFQPRLLNLEELCRQITEETQAIADKEHRIIFTAQGHTIGWLDEKLLRFILTNLLGNAMKYSPSGSNIQFDLICQNGEAMFQIEDSGIGISPTDQAQLFIPFCRGSNVGNIQGIGLGLSIVKQCVDLHDGNITIESEVGLGTKITVSLPSE